MEDLNVIVVTRLKLLEDHVLSKERFYVELVRQENLTAIKLVARTFY